MTKISKKGNAPHLGITILVYDPQKACWHLKVYADNSYLPENLRGKTKGILRLGLNNLRFRAISVYRNVLRGLKSGRTDLRDYYPQKSGEKPVYLLFKQKALSLLDNLSESGFVRAYWRDYEDIFSELAMQFFIGGCLGVSIGVFFVLAGETSIYLILAYIAIGFAAAFLTGALHIFWHIIASEIFFIWNKNDKNFKKRKCPAFRNNNSCL